MSAFQDYFHTATKSFRSSLLGAALSAGFVSLSAACLLGLSGWFLTGAALAGAAGVATAQGFNYLLPSAAIRFLAIARTLLRYTERYMGHAAALRALAIVRPHLYERIANGPPDNMLGLSRGEASARFIQDIATLENSLIAKSAPAAAFGGLIAAVALSALLGPWAALIFILGVNAAVMAGLWLGRKHARNLAHAEAEAEILGSLKQTVFELIPLTPDMAAYDLGDRILNDLDARERDLMRAKTAQASLETLVQAAALLVMAATLITLVLSQQTADLPRLALTILATTVGFETIAPLLRAIAQRQQFAAATARISGLYDLTTPMQETQQPSGDSILIYYDHPYPLDRAMRLLINGPSGSGKTQLIEALMGLRPPEHIPGLDPMSRFGRPMFSLAPQDATILTGTVRDNLMMAFTPDHIKTTPKPDLEASMIAALTDAQLGHRLTTLPKGLDTWVGDGGITLSGGERKRLAVARALLRDAPILILDEPTEGLDTATEARLIDALEARLRAENRGLILISHKPAPRRLCRDTLDIG